MKISTSHTNAGSTPRPFAMGSTVIGNISPSGMHAYTMTRAMTEGSRAAVRRR